MRSRRRLSPFTTACSTTDTLCGASRQVPLSVSLCLRGLSSRGGCPAQPAAGDQLQRVQQVYRQPKEQHGGGTRGEDRQARDRGGRQRSRDEQVANRQP